MALSMGLYLLGGLIARKTASLFFPEALHIYIVWKLSNVFTIIQTNKNGKKSEMWSKTILQ